MKYLKIILERRLEVSLSRDRSLGRLSFSPSPRRPPDAGSADRRKSSQGQVLDVGQTRGYPLWLLHYLLDGDIPIGHILWLSLWDYLLSLYHFWDLIFMVLVYDKSMGITRIFMGISLWLAFVVVISFLGPSEIFIWCHWIHFCTKQGKAMALGVPITIPKNWPLVSIVHHSYWLV